MFGNGNVFPFPEKQKHVSVSTDCVWKQNGCGCDLFLEKNTQIGRMH
jgi:hypothetical protein